MGYFSLSNKDLLLQHHPVINISEKIIKPNRLLIIIIINAVERDFQVFSIILWDDN